MAWQNAFDLGPCSLIVYGSDGSTLWHGVLSKGQSSPTFAGSSGDVMQASVDSNGVADLVRISGSTPSNSYTLGVIAGYQLVGNSVRVRAIGMGINPNAVHGQQAFASENTSGVVNLSWTGTSWSPDPCDVTSTLGGPSDTTNGFYVYSGA